MSTCRGTAGRPGTMGRAQRHPSFPSQSPASRQPSSRLDVLLPLRLRGERPAHDDRSSGGSLFTLRTGFALLALFLASVAMAQVQARDLGVGVVAL